jgi:arginyl-tRNA synthetase
MEKMLSKAIKDALKKIYQLEVEDSKIQLQKTRAEFTGDVTLVVFPFVKDVKKSPEQIAKEIGEELDKNVPEIAGFNVVKGFLNLSIAPSYWLQKFNEIYQNKLFGIQSKSTNQTYMVEYSSPNTNKPLHLGHLRNNFLGYSVAEIMKAAGHTVYKTQIINDRGIHICKSMLAWQKFGNGETPETSGIKGDHLVGKYYVIFDKEYKKQITELVNKGVDEETAKKQAPILLEAQEMLKKWEEGDLEVRALWEKMNSWVYEGFAQTYKMMGVDFDELYYESETYLKGKEIVLKGLEDGVFYKKDDGSVWCDLSDYNLDDKLLLRADGTSVYMTQDIGTAVERYEKHQDLTGLIYTVGNEQNHHFKVLFIILKKLGYKWAEKCYHLSYGMVDLPSGKMKSREGTVVDADDLMQSVINDAKEMTQERGHIDEMTETEKEELYKMIGLGSLKYFLLKVDPKRRMLFDPKESIDLNGNTAPFIQYAHARIQSLLSKAKEKGFEPVVDKNIEPEKIELDLVQAMLEFPVVVNQAANEYSPALIANYIYELVKMYNHYYQTIPILREEDKVKIEWRLALSKKVANVIKNGMLLLGIQVPDRM